MAWKLHKNSAGIVDSWEIPNPTRIDFVSANDKDARARGGSRVVVKGQRVVPSPPWLRRQGLPDGSDEVRTYFFLWGEVDIAINDQYTGKGRNRVLTSPAVFPPGSTGADIVNYLALEPNGWKSVTTMWWQYQ